MIRSDKAKFTMACSVISTVLVLAGHSGCHLIFPYRELDQPAETGPADAVAADQQTQPRDGPRRDVQQPADSRDARLPPDTLALDLPLDALVPDLLAPDLGCPTGLTLCQGLYVDTSKNKNHCGKCKNSCVSSKNADSCVAGKCVCGAKGTKACGSGLDCKSGVCKCLKGGSCVGCCVGNTCHTGSALSRCGSGGKPCDDCDDGKTCTKDSCSAKTCKHTDHPSTVSCTVGAKGGKCLKGTCCTTCIKSNQCVLSVSANACGKNGTACTNCQSLGKECKGGICVSAPGCTTASCSSGCCQGKACIPYWSQTNLICGTGKICAPCPPTDVCGGGQCLTATCGSCAGCCVGGFCSAASNTKCGKNGSFCIDCTKFSAICCGGRCCTKCCNLGGKYVCC